MTKYQRGKIYKVIDNTNDNVYIGSTTQELKRRLSGHKAECKKNVKEMDSFKIIRNNDFDIELIEDYPCNTKRELEKREQHFIDTMECINTRRAFQTKENRLEVNRKSDRKRTRDHKPYLKNYRAYRTSWGGDARSNNNLLTINHEIFL